MSTTNLIALGAACLAILAPSNLQTKGVDQYQIDCKAQSCLVRSSVISFRVEGDTTAVLSPLSFSSTKKADHGGTTVISVSAFSIVPDFMKVEQGRFYICCGQILEERRRRDRHVSRRVGVDQFLNGLGHSPKFRVSIEYTDFDAILHEDHQVFTAPFIKAIEQARLMIRSNGTN